jgi:D-alanine-D-alanine ligase
MVDTRGTPWIIDVNTSPGMTDTSLLPMAAQSAGLAFPALCERIVHMALSRGAATEDVSS